MPEMKRNEEREKKKKNTDGRSKRLSLPPLPLAHREDRKRRRRTTP